MRLLKKFNQYMLEHHPLTWHSKFIQLMIAGLLFWLISYLCGYLMVNLSVLKYQYLQQYYSRSNFISFHVIYCLVVICLWAIYFYKNNAIKSFYPLQRFYLVRLFVQLFVAFVLLVSADIPFTEGCFAKARTLLPEGETEKDIDALNLGAAFLVQSQENYKFTNRKDLDALGYDRLHYDSDSKKWDEGFEYYFYPELLDDKYVAKAPAYREFVTANDSNVTVIDSNRYLFFSTVTKYSGPDSCYSITLVKDFHKLDYIRNLHLYAIENYNTNKFNYLRDANLQRFNDNELPKVHRWAENDELDSIRRAIQGLIEVCKKYDVEYDLDPELIATYLNAKNSYGLQSITQNYASDYAKSSFSLHYQEAQAVLAKYEEGKALDPADSAALIEAMESQNYFFYDSETLNDMISSYESGYKGYKLKDIYGFLFLAFFMAWLFIFFEFANIVSLLISIPVGGVVAILVAIVIVYLNVFYRMDYPNGEYDRHTAEKASIAIVFCVCLLIFLFTLYGLFSKRFNKKVLNVLINLSYVLAPVLIGLFFGTLNVLSGHEEYMKCDSSYVYNYTQLLDPMLFLLYAFVGVCCYFPLVIKWRAKEE